MKLKTKVSFGVVFLFAVILATAGVGMYYIRSLSNDAANILKNNYETLVYTKRIIEACDSLGQDSVQAKQSIINNFTLQRQNLTEPGEAELTEKLEALIKELDYSRPDSTVTKQIRAVALSIQDLNMNAIIRKNEITQATTAQATRYMAIIITLFSLIGFTFVINFPGYIADPIIRLTEGIKSIANKKFEERLHFNRKDEFRELAEAFNQLAEKLDEFEHSNLAKILAEKKRIETIIGRMSDPVIGLDARRKVIFANEQALGLLHLTPDKILDRYAPDVALENDLFRALIRDDQKKDDEDKSLLKAVVDKKENYFSKERLTIDYTPTGEIKSIVAGEVIILKNVTPYKELDLAKTNFIATISHELKTPIASIQTCSQLLQDGRIGNLNEEQKKIIITLDDEIRRLSKITHELLDLTQVESGNVKLNIQATDPSLLIDRAIEAVKFQAERKQVRIETQIHLPLEQVLVDADKTTWVIVNLLTNAVRYSPENEKVILSCKPLKKKVRFSVQDFGLGIEPKYLDRIFDKYFQIPGTASGTGLGLAICKEFIEAQGGQIFVDSKEGEGSTFYFDVEPTKNA